MSYSNEETRYAAIAAIAAAEQYSGIGLSEENLARAVKRMAICGAHEYAEGRIVWEDVWTALDEHCPAPQVEVDDAE